MAVAQFVKHVGADNEKFFARHFRADAPGVGVMYGIPVYVFPAEEAVVFVKNCPSASKLPRGSSAYSRTSWQELMKAERISALMIERVDFMNDRE